MWLLALTPVLIVLALMLIARTSSSRAGPVGWFAAAVIGVAAFGADLDVLIISQARALILALRVFFLLWSALALYRVVDEGGGLQAICGWVVRLTGEPVMQALILAWVFVSFVQGTGGFGVPIAVVCPMLLSMGYDPIPAIVIPTIGHVWAITFGSLATSFTALVSMTALPAETLAPPSAFILGVMAVGCGFAVAHAVDGWRGIRRAVPALFIVGGVMAAALFLLATNGLWAIGSAGAAIAGLGASVLVARMPRYSVEADYEEPPCAPGQNRPTLFWGAFGYLLLTALALVARLADPVRDFLGGVVLAPDFPATATALGHTVEGGQLQKINLFGDTGALLLYAAIITYLVYKRRGYYTPGVERRIAVQVFKKGIPSALGIISMMAMANFMVYTGMMQQIADGLRFLGPDLYAFGAPAIGALGAITTGSNVNSNVVFSELQRSAADLMGLLVPLILAAQTAGASIGVALSPARITVGTTTANIPGKEGDVLRVLVRYVVPLLIAIAVMVIIGGMA
jgi:lactate permease